MSNLSTGASYCFAPQATQKSTHLALVFLFGSPPSLFWFSAVGLHNTIQHDCYARTVKLSARFCCQVKTSSYFFCRKQVQQARSWCERKNANSDSTTQSKQSTLSDSFSFRSQSACYTRESSFTSAFKTIQNSKAQIKFNSCRVEPQTEARNLSEANNAVISPSLQVEPTQVKLKSFGLTSLAFLSKRGLIPTNQIKQSDRSQGIQSRPLWTRTHGTNKAN